MSTLIVLLILQITGVGLSAILFYYQYHSERKMTFISNRIADIHESDLQSETWLVDYFQLYPHSTLRHAFPEAYKIAMATKRYKELNRLKQSGHLSKKRYEKKLKKILDLIDIKSELEFHNT
jgi:hypothetical protein